MKLRVAGLAVIVVIAVVLFKTCGTTQGASHQAALTWVAPGPMTPPVTYTYSVQRANVSGGPYTTVKTGITTTSYTDAGLAANTKYCYVVIVSATGFLDSVPSNEFCGTTLQDSAPNASGLAGVIQ